MVGARGEWAASWAESTVQLPGLAVLAELLTCLCHSYLDAMQTVNKRLLA